MNSTDVAKDMLAYTMLSNKQSIKNLLSRNGIELPAQATDKDIVVATLMASSRSPFFKSELTNTLSKNASTLAQEYSSFAGGQFEIGNEADKMMFTGEDGFFNQVGYINPKFAAGVSQAVKAPPQPKLPTKREQRQAKRTERKEEGKGVFPWLKENVLTQENVNAAIGIGINAINNRVAQRGNQIYYESDDVLRRQAMIGGMGYGQPRPQTNATTIALVVLGVAVLGVILYVSLKKNK